METKLAQLTNQSHLYEVYHRNPDSLPYRRNEMPVGTVISSFLPWSIFQKEVGGDKEWCPCDGRPAPGSKFNQLIGQEDVPDLRGLFLRGKNQIDPENTETKSKHALNPDEPAGYDNAQPENFKSHNHNLSNIDIWTVCCDKNYDVPGVELTAQNQGSSPKANINSLLGLSSSGGIETRPVNMSVYYYIKIN